jgi:hypothetical protein
MVQGQGANGKEAAGKASTAIAAAGLAASKARLLADRAAKTNRPEDKAMAAEAAAKAAKLKQTAASRDRRGD